VTRPEETVGLPVVAGLDDAVAAVLGEHRLRCWP
jgi:hypothetical protein